MCNTDCVSDEKLDLVANRLRGRRGSRFSPEPASRRRAGCRPFGAAGDCGGSSGPRTSRHPRRSAGIPSSSGSGTRGVASWSRHASPIPRTTSSRDGRSEFERCTVITQNVDDLHVRAGTSNLIRVHGSLWELSCWRGVRRVRRGATSRCRCTRCRRRVRACGGLARPAVVWFGESLPAPGARRGVRGVRLRRVPDRRHVGAGLSSGGPRSRGPAPRRVHGRDQPRTDARLRCESMWPFTARPTSCSRISPSALHHRPLLQQVS